MAKQFIWADEEAFSLSVSFYTALMSGFFGWVVARHITKSDFYV